MMQEDLLVKVEDVSEFFFGKDEYIILSIFLSYFKKLFGVNIFTLNGRFFPSQVNLYRRLLKNRLQKPNNIQVAYYHMGLYKYETFCTGLTIFAFDMKAAIPAINNLSWL